MQDENDDDVNRHNGDDGDGNDDQTSRATIACQLQQALLLGFCTFKRAGRKRERERARV